MRVYGTRSGLKDYQGQVEKGHGVFITDRRSLRPVVVSVLLVESLHVKIEEVYVTPYVLVETAVQVTQRRVMVRRAADVTRLITSTLTYRVSVEATEAATGPSYNVTSPRKAQNNIAAGRIVGIATEGASVRAAARLSTVGTGLRLRSERARRARTAARGTRT